MSVRNLLWQGRSDHQSGTGGYDRLQIIDRGDDGYDVVLRIDGGYAHPAEADSARAYWQRVLDTTLAELGGESAA
jgi:hypothetical protein